MSDLSLRAYHRKIENWIEENKTDQAIAHIIQLILEFAKDISSWRCLSKALLQKRDFENADQVFNVILRVDPDDFVAHIGKSMAAENRGELDDSVEHMRRAFEIQPANEGLQNELKRLMNKKDGVEPDKIRLTRGALIKMYVRGSLLEQAIAEALIGIRENPQRMDYHLALAEGYEKTGEYTKAVETCVNILKELPFCQKANEIMHRILGMSDSKEIPQIYHQRLTALDPYYAYVTQDTETVLNVPDIAVMVADRSDNELNTLPIDELIIASWKKNNENEKVFEASDWQSIIDKALIEPREELGFALGEYEEVSETEMNKKDDETSHEPQSRKEAFLGRLRTSSEHSERKSTIPDWIFDDDGDLVHQPLENPDEEEPEFNFEQIEMAHVSDLDDNLELMAEPVFTEPLDREEAESVWVNEDEHDNGKGISLETKKLQDTQEIKIPDYEPVYMLDIAEKAVIGENYKFALATFRKLIDQDDYIDDVIRQLEMIVRDHPDNSDLSLLLGELYTRQGRRAEALAVYKKAQKNISL